MHTAPRILYMRAFAPCFAGKPSGLNVRNIVAAAPAFRGHCAAIDATLASAYAAAATYVKTFESVRMIDEHAREWDAAAYGATVAADNRRLRADLRTYRAWKAELDKMKARCSPLPFAN